MNTVLLPKYTVLTLDIFIDQTGLQSADLACGFGG